MFHVFKGFECLGLSIFFSFCFCASFGKELFFKGGEEEEEDSIIEYPNTDKRERRL